MNQDNFLLDIIKFSDQGLVPVIVQDFYTLEVLMLAWMNREALEISFKTRQACYFSRSRNKLWKKGESSGQTQKIIEIVTDCDRDSLLLKVEQNGVACHTGRKSCFFNNIKQGGEIEINQGVIIKPENLYGKTTI